MLEEGAAPGLIQYDDESDGWSMYLDGSILGQLLDPLSPVKVAYSVVCSHDIPRADWINVDIAYDGRVIGIEVTCASGNLDRGLLHNFAEYPDGVGIWYDDASDRFGVTLAEPVSRGTEAWACDEGITIRANENGLIYEFIFDDATARCPTWLRERATPRRE